MFEMTVKLIPPLHAGRRLAVRAALALALVGSLAPQAGAAQGRNELQIGRAHV